MKIYRKENNVLLLWNTVKRKVSFNSIKNLVARDINFLLGPFCAYFLDFVEFKGSEVYEAMQEVLQPLYLPKDGSTNVLYSIELNWAEFQKR